MDILKLLSRSTNLKNKSATGSQSSNLPSAGTSSNPQLYHDPVPGQKGIKRKRVEKIQGQKSLVTTEELDFFAPKAEKKQTARKNDNESSDNNIDKDNSNLLTTNLPAELKMLDEDECKQILRSHRVKITVLAAKEKSKENVEKPKKSKKRKIEVVTTTKVKSEYKQIYPQPLMAFEDLPTQYGISKRLGENLAQQGYKIPTEVQMGSLPLLLKPELALGPSLDESTNASHVPDIDLLAVAPTGSGKTLAFLIPVVNSMIQRRRENKLVEGHGHRLEAIIVAPTKELANQIVNEGRKLAMGTGIKVVGMRKGMRVVDGPAYEDDSEESSSEDDDENEPIKTASKAVKRSSQPTARADVLVTTPLVLLNALSTASSGDSLTMPTVRHLVLDEADVLLDPLFREQTQGIWKACTNPGLHVTLWSATMGSNIEALAMETIQSRRQKLKLETPSTAIRLVVGLKDSAIPNISHRLIYAANEPGKLIALRQLLHPTAKSADSTQSLRPPFLVFTQTIPRAIALHSELLYDIPAEAGGSSRIAVLHSDLSDVARDHVMTRFRNGEIWILITTDILSRGVDFRGINGVVNYDVPNSGASYIHRVGRTGRAGRDGGVAVTFYTKEDIPYVKNVANIIAASEKQAGKTPAEGGLQQWLLNALPTPSKQEKKKLKMYGVEARRTGLGDTQAQDKRSGKGKGMGRAATAKISTKSGFERKLENRKKGAIQGSRRRKEEGNKMETDGDAGAAEDSEWGGIEE